MQNVSMYYPMQTNTMAADSTQTQGAGSTDKTDPNQTMFGDIGSTFLTLLTTQLKTQDPLAPMDSTQMVGQMISLNQLDQLIGLRSDFQKALTPTNSSTTSPAGGQ